MGENRDLVSSAETLSTLSPDPTVFRSTLSGLMGVHVSSLFRALSCSSQTFMMLIVLLMVFMITTACILHFSLFWISV